MSANKVTTQIFEAEVASVTTAETGSTAAVEGDDAVSAMAEAAGSPGATRSSKRDHMVISVGPQLKQILDDLKKQTKLLEVIVEQTKAAQSRLTSLDLERQSACKEKSRKLRVAFDIQKLHLRANGGT